jgi:Acyl-ACP thioesterase
VRFTDIDLFDHMNNSVYWSVVEDYLSATPEQLNAPLRVTIEHEAPIALGDKLDIIAHVHRRVPPTTSGQDWSTAPSPLSPIPSATKPRPSLRSSPSRNRVTYKSERLVSCRWTKRTR